MMDSFFLCLEMFIVGSSYYNMALGNDKGDVEKDERGLGTMKVLGRNMAFLLKKLKAQMDEKEFKWSIKEVCYEFQKDGDEMLHIKS